MWKFACRTSTLLRGVVLAVTFVSFFPVLAGLLKASAHVPHHKAAGRAEAAKYRGVCYFKQDRVFGAWLRVEARPGYIGRFKNAKQAAEAYDREVRRMYPDDTPHHKFRRKSWLNFPSEEEAAYVESPEQSRKRGLKRSSSNRCKEARSFELLREAFYASPYSENYELVRLTGSSKADALFKLRGSSQAGLPIQLKAATSRWKQGRFYVFQHLLGYDGMLVFLVALDGGHIWATAGAELKVDKLGITIGCASDTARRVEDAGALSVACFKNRKKFPHISVEAAERQCSPGNRLEVAVHRQLRHMFTCMNWSLTCPLEHQTTVDSLLEVRIGHPLVRLQEKASHLHERSGRYDVQMSKYGGSLGRLSYAKDDFDLLVPVPTSPVQSPADDDEHRPPVVPVSSGHISSGMLSAHSDSADEPTESPSEEVPAPTEVHEGPGEEPPSFEEVEFLLDEAALRGSASASSGIGPVNPPTSPVTSPAEEMEFVDEGSAATGLPSGSLFDSAKLRESVPVHTSSVYVTSPTEIVPTDLPAPTSPVTSPADEVETQTIREALLPQLQQEVHTEMPVPTEMPSPSAAYDEDEEEAESKP
ncbi:Zan [Symbiodinium sp. CCMP2456]|nr:Zan [Symbiodinium sp. CCMP2456]